MPPALTRLNNRLASTLVALLLGVVALPALADIWGYVDAKGVAHFSTQKLDERYELFFKGGESFSIEKSDRSSLTPLDKSPPDVIQPASSARAPTKLLAFFDVSPNYKAVKHLLKDAAQTHGIDYELIQALIATESGFDTHAVSPKGAVGLMQLMPPTAERFGVKADKTIPIQKKLTDPKTNISAGTAYLRYLIRLFPGQLELALAAYNAGEGAVQRAGNKIPNYPETKNYVKTVMQLYGHLKPPVAVIEARKVPGRARMEISGRVHVETPGRVRMEMMGGVPSVQGRSNMPPLLVAVPDEPLSFPESKAK